MTKEEYLAGEPEGEENMEPRETKVGGVVMREDDFEVGQYVACYNIKHNPDEPAPIMGQSMQITAICLPYFVATLLASPQKPTVTMDTRFLTFMKVTEKYVKAQMDGYTQPPAPEMEAVPSPKKVKKAPPQ